MIRLVSIELTNFKSVKHGKAVLSSWKNGESYPKADVIGIYGQNASGKTSIVKALDVLKRVLIGIKVDSALGYKDCIRKGETRSLIKAQMIFSSRDEGSKKEDVSQIYTYELRLEDFDGEIVISGERLSCKDLSEERRVAKAKVLFEYEVTKLDKKADQPKILDIDRQSGNEVPNDMQFFSDSASIKSSILEVSESFKTEFDKNRNIKIDIKPKTVWSSISRFDNALKTEFEVAQRIAFQNHKSLLFSEEMRRLFMTLFEALPENEDELAKTTSSQLKNTIFPTFLAVFRIRKFSIKDFAIVEPFLQAGPMVNALRISTHYDDDIADASFDIDLNESIKVSQKQYEILYKTIAEISPVLGALVPGLLIEVEKIDSFKFDDGSTGVIVELVSKRGDVTVPLRSESEGIKKLLTILVLLIDVYAKPGSCIVIDELDSSIFEFLLGELIQVLNDNGRGQLIFTAHNLRPLEVLNPGSLIFTTTNENNRYIKFKGMHSTNNLRDQYLRAINLGGLPETIYEGTNKFDIDGAFYEAKVSAR